MTIEPTHSSRSVASGNGPAWSPDGEKFSDFAALRILSNERLSLGTPSLIQLFGNERTLRPRWWE